MEIWGEIDSKVSMITKRVEEAECRMGGAPIYGAAGCQGIPVSKIWALVP